MALKFEILPCTEPRAPVVILSAGLGGHGSFWKPQLAALREGFRVVVYDHRGTGQNAGDLSAHYTIEEMADDVEEIAESVGEARYHFVGHALGGLVGLALARRPHSRCASLCLVNSWATLDVHTSRCFDVRLSLLDHAGVPAYVKAQPIFLYPAAWLSRNAEMVSADVVHGIRTFQGASNLRARVGALRSFDATNDLAALNIATLIYATRDDILVPYTASEVLAARIAGARLILLPEGGHGFTVTQAPVFNRDLLGFLKEADRG